MLVLVIVGLGAFVAGAAAMLTLVHVAARSQPAATDPSRIVADIRGSYDSPGGRLEIDLALMSGTLEQGGRVIESYLFERRGPRKWWTRLTSASYRERCIQLAEDRRDDDKREQASSELARLTPEWEPVDDDLEHRLEACWQRYQATLASPA